MERDDRILQYDIQALKNNIDRIDENIEVFRLEIRKMEDEKDHLRKMIIHLESKS